MSFRDGPRGGGISLVGRASKPPPVDREKVCPFLLRAFVKEGGFHRFETFSAPLPKDDEVDVHTWTDCTIRELASLIGEQLPAAAVRTARLSFKVFYKDAQRGRYSFNDVGTVYNSRSSPDDSKTLGEVNVQIGDIVSVAILSGAEAESRGPISRANPRDGQLGDRDRERDRETRPAGGGRMAGRLGPARGAPGGSYHPYSRPGPGGPGGPGPRGQIGGPGGHPWDVPPQRGGGRGGWGGNWR